MSIGNPELSQKVSDLNQAESPNDVKTAYEALMAVDADKNEEQAMVREALKRNQEKLIASNISGLEATMERLKALSELSLGDHVGNLTDGGIEVAKAGTNIATGVLKSGTNQVVKGAASAYEVASDAFEANSKKHPKATAVVTALGGAAAAAALIKLYGWVSDENAGWGKKTLRFLGVGAAAATVLGVVGINAKEAVAEIPAAKADQTPDKAVVTETETEDQPEPEVEVEVEAEPEPELEDDEPIETDLWEKIQTMLEGGVSNTDIEQMFADEYIKEYLFTAEESKQDELTRAIRDSNPEIWQQLKQAAKHWNTWALHQVVVFKMSKYGLNKKEAAAIIDSVKRVESSPMPEGLDSGIDLDPDNRLV